VIADGNWRVECLAEQMGQMIDASIADRYQLADSYRLAAAER
jgi:hypothetical protein